MTVSPAVDREVKVHEIASESTADSLRTICVNVRMNRREIKVLDGVCRAFGARRAEMLRALALLGVPSPVPEINRSALHLIASMSSDLRRLLELVSYDSESIDLSEHLLEIEEHFSAIRAALLGA